MPFIHVSISTALPAQQKEKIHTSLGDFMNVLPGKMPEQALIQISDCCDMYRRGFTDPLCIVEISLYQMQSFANKSELTKKLSALLQKVCDLKPENLYIKFNELSVWGVNGVLK